MNVRRRRPGRWANCPSYGTWRSDGCVLGRPSPPAGVFGKEQIARCAGWARVGWAICSWPGAGHGPLYLQDAATLLSQTTRAATHKPGSLAVPDFSGARLLGGQTARGPDRSPGQTGRVRLAGAGTVRTGIDTLAPYRAFCLKSGLSDRPRSYSADWFPPNRQARAHSRPGVVSSRRGCEAGP